MPAAPPPLSGTGAESAGSPAAERVCRDRMVPASFVVHSRLLACVLLAAVPVSAQPHLDLAQMEVEDLMRLDVRQVVGAADRLQPVTEVPSSVTIVTADEIARHGYRTLADVLRGVRGFFVTDDRNYSYVGTRGFNRPGDYSTRVLLLVNGHRVNDNVYDQASIGADFGIDAAMFERVEVIRGPASSLYGTNALFAIVNVITRSGASLNGVSIDLDGGTLGTGLARVAAGRRLADGTDFALSATWGRSDGMRRLYFPAHDTPETSHGIAEDLDREEAGQIYGRYGRAYLTVTGTFGRRVKRVPTASYATLFNAQDPPEQTTERRGSLSAQYARPIGRSRLSLVGSFDHAGYAGVYPYPVDGAVSVFRDGSRGTRWSVGGRVSRPLPGRQTLTLGGDFIDNLNQDQWGGYSDTADGDFVLDRSSRQGALYVQDELRATSWLILNFGLRHDRYSNFDRTTPRAAVIAAPAPGHALKYLYGRAFRAPNAYELYYYRDPGAHLLRPESIDTHEWSWEADHGDRARTTISAYRYRAHQLLELGVIQLNGPAGDYGFRNAGETRAAGLEIEGELRGSRAQALASYAVQNARDGAPGGLPLTNSPRHVAKARLSVDGLRAGSFVSLDWQYLSRRRTLGGATIGAASVVNVTAAWPLGQRVSLTGQLRNLLGARYADPASAEHLMEAIEQNGRTLRAGLRWKLWTPR
jgi:outer membrane receptor for ferrienterochelin and colicins